MSSLKVAYVALVWPRSSIHTKVVAQQHALLQMVVSGEIKSLTTVNCATDELGDDWVRIGSSPGVRLRRAGRFHSPANLLFAYPRLYRMIVRELTDIGVDVVYLRKPPVFDPRSVRFMRRLRARGIRVVLEIPTFPYDRELIEGSFQYRLDRAARRKLADAVDRIATFSHHARIYGVPCVRIDNAVDIASLPLAARSESAGVRVTVVASLQRWHRLDRVLVMVLDAWRKGDYRIECLNIVGEGPESRALSRIVGEAGLEAAHRVRFCGPLYGAELSAVFDRTDLAFGNLEEQNDRGLTNTKALKHREYAARGIPFVYGLADHSFSGSSYALRIDDGPLNLDSILSWYDGLSVTRADIRKDAMRFNWTSQFRRVFRDILGFEGTAQRVDGSAT